MINHFDKSIVATVIFPNDQSVKRYIVNPKALEKIEPLNSSTTISELIKETLNYMSIKIEFKVVIIDRK